MAIPGNKDELLEAISTNFNLLKNELAVVPESWSTSRELEGHAKGTVMSVKDMAAYLNGWGQLVLKWNRDRDNGKQVDFPETGYKWNELGKLAQKFYQDYEQTGYRELLALLDNTVDDITTLVSRKTNAQLYSIAWYEKYTLGRMIQLNTSSPFQNARLRIRKWKKSKGLQ